MIKVKLSIYLDNDYEEYIETTMPYLPKLSSKFGVWIEGTWTILMVSSIIHEFDLNNNFLITEINLTDWHNEGK